MDMDTRHTPLCLNASPDSPQVRRQVGKSLTREEEEAKDPPPTPT